MNAQITGVVLAGGQGRRMGGVDKGLQNLAGRPLAAWVADRLAPQVRTLLINANRNPALYAELGFPVVPDVLPGFFGPLAGLHAALSAADTPLVATVPCDSPFLPADLMPRLHAALCASGAGLALARTFDRPHPVFCLCRRSLLPELQAYLSAGGRKALGWHADAIEVDFDDQTEAFGNINTLQELAHAERRLAGGGR